jgi:tripartite-type tricarboxylate transporter receptor subunit TctC
MHISIKTTLTLLAAASLMIGGDAKAAGKSFYKGKTVKLTVGYGPGGGFDTYARLLARHWGRNIAGSPRIIVQNRPGASSLKAVQFLRRTAPKDGTAVVTFNSGQITRSLVLPSKKYSFDWRDFAWIGSVDRDISVCYLWAPRFKTKTLAGATKNARVNFGLTSAGSASYFNQSILKNIFGVNIKQVAGYKGSKTKQFAIERGELDGDCGAWTSIPPNWLNEKKVNVLLRISPYRPDNMPKSIPSAFDAAPNEDAKKIIKLLVAATEVGRPYITRKDVPADRLKALRTGFNATMKDAAFLVEAKKQRRSVSPLTDKESIAVVNTVYGLSKEIIAKAKKILIKRKKRSKKKKK